MSRTDPRAFTGLRHAAEPGPSGASVPRPTGGLIPARILDPPRGPENRAHRRGVAIPVAVDAPLRRADAQTHVRDDSIRAIGRSMAPDDGRVTGALGAGKTRIDDLEQVGHRASQTVCTVPPDPALRAGGRAGHICLLMLGSALSQRAAVCTAGGECPPGRDARCYLAG